MWSPKKQEADELAGFLTNLAIQQLGGTNILSSRAFGALADGVVHSLAFAEFVETDSVEV